MCTLVCYRRSSTWQAQWNLKPNHVCKYICLHLSGPILLLFHSYGHSFWRKNNRVLWAYADYIVHSVGRMRLRVEWAQLLLFWDYFLFYVHWDRTNSILSIAQHFPRHSIFGSSATIFLSISLISFLLAWWFLIPSCFRAHTVFHTPLLAVHNTPSLQLFPRHWRSNYWPLLSASVSDY